jgi:hypothetical protein
MEATSRPTEAGEEPELFDVLVKFFECHGVDVGSLSVGCHRCIGGVA